MIVSTNCHFVNGQKQETEGGQIRLRKLTVALDSKSDVPLYEQLTRHIIGEIRAGRMVAGEKLPGVRSLCEHLQISRSTAESAYQILVAEGYIEGRERSGNYVLPYERPIAPVGDVPILPPESLPDVYRHRFSTAEVDTSEFPYRAWAKLYKQVLQDGSGLLSRGHGQGDIELRQALSDFLHQYRGVRCAAAQIVLGAGVDALMGMLLILLGTDAVYGLEDPGYPANYRTMNNSNRCSMPVPLDAQGMDDGALRASGANIAYVTPSHQFPTGVTMPAGRRARLLSWANEERYRYIIEDDYDSEFRHTTRPIPAMQGMDPEKVIYIGTFNRSIAPSIRVAYMVLPQALLLSFRELYAHTACSVSRFEQQTLALFLKEGHYQRHLRRMAGLYRRRRDALIEAMGCIENISLSGHEAGLHCLLTHDRLDEQALICRANESGILVHGLSEYAHGEIKKSHSLVLGYGGIDEMEIRSMALLLKDAWRS